MLRKPLAIVLLILSALPFTAPFATVDMPTLLGQHPLTAHEQTSLTPSVEDGSHALVASAARGRVRFRSLLRLETALSTALVALIVPDVDRTPSAAFRRGDHPALTALRI
jgi:hypothetical protein